MQFKRLGFLALGVFGLFILSTPSFAQYFPYYVLDGWGGVHAGGGASALTHTPTFFGWDIAKAIDYGAVGYSSSIYGHGVLVLDGYGGVHRGGEIAHFGVTPSAYFGWNIARDIVMRVIPPRAYYSSLSSGNTALTSSTYVAIRSVTMYFPDDTYVLMTASCPMGNNDSVNDAVAHVAFGVDSTTTEADNLMSEEAFPHNYNSGMSWYLTWHTCARSQMVFVSAGAHTFYFLARRAGGTATLYYYDPTMAVVAIDQGYYGYSAPDVQSSASQTVTGGKR